MFNWICHNRDMFLVNYTEIGMSQKFAVELENEHSQFANSAVVSLDLFVYLTRLGFLPYSCLLKSFIILLNTSTHYEWLSRPCK